MRYFQIWDYDNPEATLVSEEEILETYFPYWKEQLTKQGKLDYINTEECIRDWVTLHWAIEITPS